jgi:hypothetical protein
MKKLILLSMIIFVAIGCDKDETPSNEQSGITDTQEVANLNVADRFILDPNSEETTNDINANSAAAGSMPVKTDVENANTIIFTPSGGAGGTPVTAVGLRFGPTGDIIFRPVTT